MSRRKQARPFKVHDENENANCINNDISQNDDQSIKPIQSAVIVENRTAENFCVKDCSGSSERIRRTENCEYIFFCLIIIYYY